MGPYLRKLNAILTRIAEAITVLALAVIAIVIPYEVLGRYVLADMPAWSGETATFSLVWLSMMGSAVGFRKGYQISLNSLIDRLPPRSARIIVRSGLFLLMAFLIVMIYYGAEQTAINWHQLSPALGIPMALPYAALPAGFGLMLLSALEEASDFS